jgi:hypothetical protein
MKRVAVDLGDHAGVPPHEIDLNPLNAGVRLGPRQTVVVAEAQEALLQLAPGHRASGGVAGQHRL